MFRSSIEAEIGSLDAGLRMDGIPAFVRVGRCHRSVASTIRAQSIHQHTDWPQRMDSWQH